METVHCHKCGLIIDGGNYCPNCGMAVSSKSILLHELKSEQPAMNGFVRFIGGLSVFVAVIVLFLFTFWSIDFYQTNIERHESRYDAPFGLESSNRSETVTQISLVIFSVGLILGLVLMGIGEGLILAAQVREEHARTLRLVNRLVLLLIDTP